MVHIQHYSKWYINTHLDGGLNVGWGHITRFYGNLEASKREYIWKLLEFLYQGNNLPWMVVGELNEIIGVSEKAGGGIGVAKQMENFRVTIDVCELRDLRYVGVKFEWKYIKRDGTQIRGRLDRALR